VSTSEREERARFEAFYRRKWEGHEGFWEDRYPPEQVVYARALYRRRNAEIAAAVGTGVGTALDLGCGVGDVANLLATRAGLVIAGDVSFENVRRTRRNLRDRGNVATFHGAAERLPFADATLDVVVVADVIEHIPDLSGCLAEVGRVLRPGGRLICVTPIRSSLAAWRVVDWLLHTITRPGSREPLRAAHPEVYERFLSVGEVRAALSAAGLRPVRLRRVCFYPAPETPGVVGALLARVRRRVGARRFESLAARTVGVFAAVERLRLLNQKQLWIAVR
jgi:SAM-dependent methyltransferase